MDLCGGKKIPLECGEGEFDNRWWHLKGWARNELPSDEGREDLPLTRGVGLQLPVPLHHAASKSYQPRYQGRQRAEQEQDLESLGGVAACVAESEAPAVARALGEALADVVLSDALLSP